MVRQQDQRAVHGAHGVRVLARADRHDHRLGDAGCVKRPLEPLGVRGQRGCGGKGADQHPGAR